MALPVESPSPDHKPSAALVRELFHDARREKNRVIDRWKSYYKLFRNRSWSSYRPSWLPSPQSSEIFPTLHTITAWMTDQKPTALVAPAPDIAELGGMIDPQMLNKKTEDMRQTLDAWWVAQGQTRHMEMALLDTFTFGSGILRSGFDPTLAGGKGMPTLDRVDPWAILPDPDGSDEASINYLLEVRTVSLAELKARWPERGHLVQPESSSEVEARPRDSGLEHQPQGQLRSTGVTGLFPGTPTSGIPAMWGPPGLKPEDFTKTAVLMECWIKDHKRIRIPAITEGMEDVIISEPYWEYIAVAGGVVLSDDTSNPFEHGGLPYHRLPFAEIGEWWSIPLTEHLGPAQIALNRLLAAMQINAELVGNPMMVQDKDSGLDRTPIINRPGQVLTKNPGKELRWLEPPDVSPTVKDLIYFWRDTIDRASGISAVSRGAALRRREPAEAVDAVQEASFVRVRAALRNMEEGLRRGMEQVAANFVQHTIQPRAIPLVDSAGGVKYVTLDPYHWYYPVPGPEGARFDPLKFAVWIVAGSSLPTSRQARAAEADMLFQLGVIDQQALLEAHDWPNAAETLSRAKDENLQRSFNMLAQKGQQGG